MAYQRSIMAATLCLAAATAQAQAPQRGRDEDSARQFIYCALVSEYWYECYTHPGNVNAASALAARQVRDLFYVAAAIDSDGEYVAAEKIVALSLVQKEVQLQPARGDKQVLVGDAKDCAELFATKAAPLLKERSPPP